MPFYVFVLFNSINQEDTTFQRKEDGKLLLCQLVWGCGRESFLSLVHPLLSLVSGEMMEAMQVWLPWLLWSPCAQPSSWKPQCKSQVAHSLANSELSGMVGAVVPTSNCHWCSQVGSAGALTGSFLGSLALLSPFFLEVWL